MRCVMIIIPMPYLKIYTHFVLWVNVCCGIHLPIKQSVYRYLGYVLHRCVFFLWLTWSEFSTKANSMARFYNIVYVLVYDNIKGWSTSKQITNIPATLIEYLHVHIVSIKCTNCYVYSRTRRNIIKYKWVPPQLQVSAPTPQMCYKDMKNKTNSPLKQLEWVKEELCICSSSCVFTLVDKLDIMKFGHLS